MAEATRLDETHRPDLRSWVPVAEGNDFPIQNLPIGIFSRNDDPQERRAGFRIGDFVLDLSLLLHSGRLTGVARSAAEAAAVGSLNGLMAQGAEAASALRRACSTLLTEGAPDRVATERCLLPVDVITMHLPARIGDFTDFYASSFHANNVGRLFRPDNPLLPNYKYLPVAYHGRASTLRVSGHGFPRPRGELPKGQGNPPVYAASGKLDYEAELGIWIGPGNPAGVPVPIGEARRHLFGFCLLNDWSARDIQSWEAQPLGPFLAKNFATTISPWIVMADALAPFRMAGDPRPEGDPAPLPHLFDAEDARSGALDIQIDSYLLTAQMRRAGLPPFRLARGPVRRLYWTVAQMIAHHTSNGCALEPGDLLGSGTVSGPAPDNRSCLLERTSGGREPIDLPSGERRAFLEDGDEIILSGSCEREGFTRIGFGECRATVLPAMPG